MKNKFADILTFKAILFQIEINLDRVRLLKTRCSTSHFRESTKMVGRWARSLTFMSIIRAFLSEVFPETRESRRRFERLTWTDRSKDSRLEMFPSVSGTLKKQMLWKELLKGTFKNHESAHLWGIQVIVKLLLR